MAFASIYAEIGEIAAGETARDNQLVVRHQVPDHATALARNASFVSTEEATSFQLGREFQSPGWPTIECYEDNALETEVISVEGEDVRAGADRDSISVAASR